MRLRWILGLIVLTLALALAACGGGGDEEEENGGGEKETPAATKTVEAEGTQEPAETPKATKTAEAAEPSGGGGGASLGDIPVYPGAEKTGDYSGDYSLPLLGEDLDVEDYGNTQWAVYETGDSVDDVGSFYREKMPDNGWNEEGWFDISFGEGAAWGSYTKNDGDDAAWVVISGTEDQTEIVIGTGSK